MATVSTTAPAMAERLCHSGGHKPTPQSHPMHLQQCLVKATLLASRGRLDEAIDTVRQGLGPVPPGGSQDGVRDRLQRLELEVLLADLLGASGRTEESAAVARQAREQLLASGLDADLTQPLLEAANGILDGRSSA